MSEQFYGIKYPFNEESDRKTFFDLNETEEDGVRSMLLHIILTPKGQKLRNPEFGTNLINYIFEPNDEKTLESIKNEIVQQVTVLLPEVKFNDLKIITDENDAKNIFIEVDYTIKKNGIITNNKTIVKL
jgi:phage baseplate assembly protein W